MNELMKNELQVINEQEVLGKQFKMYGTAENPLFLAKEVAEWIDYSQSNGKYKVSQMVSKVDDDEKGGYIVDTPGGKQEMLFLTEDGLYEVLMQSRKPIAKEFKKEVKKILKQIRTTGGYIHVSEEDSELEIMSKAFMIAQKTIEKKQEIIAMKDRQIQVQEDLILEQAPKVEVYDNFLSKENIYSVNIISKSFGIKKMGRNNLYKWLRKNNYLFDGFQLYQKHIERGIGVQRTYEHKGKDDRIHVESSPYFTPKGVTELHKKLKKDGYVFQRPIEDILEELNSISFEFSIVD